MGKEGGKDRQFGLYFQGQQFWKSQVDDYVAFDLS
jgi:hypothetical protein